MRWQKDRETLSRAYFSFGRSGNLFQRSFCLLGLHLPDAIELVEIVLAIKNFSPDAILYIGFKAIKQILAYFLLIRPGVAAFQLSGSLFFGLSSSTAHLGTVRRI